MIELTTSSVLEELIPIFKGEIQPAKPLSYFGRSIMGGRGNLENDRIIVYEMEKHSTVLSKHTVLDEVFKFEEEWKKRFPKVDVYHRDMKLLRISKCFVADFTEESGGTGTETMEAYRRKKPMILFCHEKARYRRAMLHGPVWHGGYVLSTPTFEELLKKYDVKVPIFFYNNQNIKEIAEIEVRNLFEKS
jgi:nucleoside 2-deoxyribosyltransferase